MPNTMKQQAGQPLRRESRDQGYNWDFLCKHKPETEIQSILHFGTLETKKKDKFICKNQQLEKE